jgi:nitroreductase
MFQFDRPITEIIQQRFSCRAYAKIPIAEDKIRQLAAYANQVTIGPLQTRLRFELALALEHDPKALRGLGTYGLIKEPAGFILGAAQKGKYHLEDYGYALEYMILAATYLGLGTCWLGGNFAKSSFSKKVRAAKNETVPAVSPIGYPVDQIRTRDPLRQKVKSDSRQPWETLFFQSRFGNPLSKENAGAYAIPLEMVRLAPSGHNYQPWRVVQDGENYHFYLQRTHGYGPGSPMFILLNVADLQRMEIGIAMCHFELTARELGLAGQWAVDEPSIQKSGEMLEYIVTWLGN